jgi:isochorismate hydrolase
MKELYFTAENIKLRTDTFLQVIKEVHRIKKINHNYDHSALLVLDMQNYFLQSCSHAYIPSSPAIISNINSLINLFRKKSKPIIYTRHVNNNDNAKNMKIWWNDLISEYDQDSEIIEDILIPDPVIINKSQYDAFYQTGLEDYLNREGVTDIVVTGVMTHLCVESTARSGFIKGFKIIVVADGTATYNSKYHLGSLINLSHGFATVLKTADCLEKLNK